MRHTPRRTRNEKRGGQRLDAERPREIAGGQRDQRARPAAGQTRQAGHPPEQAHADSEQVQHPDQQADQKNGTQERQPPPDVFPVCAPAFDAHVPSPACHTAMCLPDGTLSKM